jgi:hypothetical protein
VTTVTLDNVIDYREGRDFAVDITARVSSTDKVSIENACSNAGKIITINNPLGKVKHYDATVDASNTVTFNITGNPTGIPSSVDLFIENYSIEPIDPNNSKYQITIRGYSD